MNEPEFTPAAGALVRLVVELSKTVALLVDELEARYAGREPADEKDRAQLRRVKGARFHLDDVAASLSRLGEFVKMARAAEDRP